MITESEAMKKLRNRDIFMEIRNKVSQIQDTTPKGKELQEVQRQEEYRRIIDDIFGED